MRNFVYGTIFGIVIATVGFSGIAKIVDHGVSKVQDVARESAK